MTTTTLEFGKTHALQIMAEAMQRLATADSEVILPSAGGGGFARGIFRSGHRAISGREIRLPGVR